MNRNFKLNKQVIKEMVANTINDILNENYPLGARYDKRAPWNQGEDDQPVTAYITAYYYDTATGEEVTKNFEEEFEMPHEWDDDGEGSGSFIPVGDPNDYFDADAYVPKHLEGLELYDYDVEFN